MIRKIQTVVVERTVRTTHNCPELGGLVSERSVESIATDHFAGCPEDLLTIGAIEKFLHEQKGVEGGGFEIVHLTYQPIEQLQAA